MKGKLLIAYASKTGSTKEVSEEIGKVLAAEGLEAEVRALGEIGSLDGYSAVVVGAPINGMAWTPEATAFVERHGKSLAAMPVAYFLLSYMLEGGRPIWRRAILRALDKASAIARPVKVGMFGGRIASALPPIARFIFGVKAGAPLDLRNWEAIRSWAKELAAAL